MERLVCVAIGYLCGLFQTGYLYGRIKNIDIREHGSGNAGTTNAIRTMGWKAGFLTFIGDCLKCVVAVLIAKLIYAQSDPDSTSLLAMYAGMGAVIGHNYPFYLGFRGGKGIAATAGLILATDPVMALIAMGLFVVLVAVTKYVSVGSLVLVVFFLVAVIIYGQLGKFYLSGTQLYEMYGIAALLMVLAFYKHRENIRKLFRGTDNKLALGKKE